MSRRRKPRIVRPWQPQQPATPITLSAERRAALVDTAARAGLDVARVTGLLDAEREMWMNDRYTVTVQRDPDSAVDHLSIRRNDRKPDIPWRHLQRIKNELAGDDTEAIELFPAESRLVDTANQRWLWCARPGTTIDVGFRSGRHVSGPDDAGWCGAVQAPIDDTDMAQAGRR